MRNRALLSVLGTTAIIALACTGSGTTEEEAFPDPPPVENPPDVQVEEPAEEPAGEPAEEPAEEPAAPGATPFEFPTVALSGEAGQFVLVPSRQPLDDALSTGGQSGTFIYYGATLLEAGPEASTVRSLAGTEFSMPNSMIIPIPRGQTAQVGDILLGQWESGSGLQRAIVVGGTPTEPVVRYLDIGYDNPSGWGQKDDTFQPDRFVVLNSAGEVGASVACQDGSRYNHGILTAVSGDRILVSGFAGSLTAHNRGECVDITPRPLLNVGDTVQVPVVGSYSEGTVKSVDMSIGRVTVAYSWAGSEEEKVFSIVDVTPSFEAPAPSAPANGEAPPPAADDDKEPTDDGKEPTDAGDGDAGDGDAGDGDAGDGDAGDGDAGDGDEDGNSGNGGSNLPFDRAKGKFKGKLKGR